MLKQIEDRLRRGTLGHDVVRVTHVNVVSNGVVVIYDVQYISANRNKTGEITQRCAFLQRVTTESDDKPEYVLKNVIII